MNNDHYRLEGERELREAITSSLHARIAALEELVRRLRETDEYGLLLSCPSKLAAYNAETERMISQCGQTAPSKSV